MNRTFLVAWLAVFVAWMAGSFVVHGNLLRPDYLNLPNLFRPEEEAGQYFHLMLLAHVIMAGAFVWIYSRGIETAPWVPQGLRYGLAIALLALIPTYMIYYVVQPMPGSLAIKQIVYDGVLLLLLGVLVAWFYRRQAGAA